jgi:hypothetical protein
MPSDNPGQWPIEIIVHSDDDFIAFARSLGYTDETINDTPFQSINSLDLPLDSPYCTHEERVCRLHIPMWRWEVDNDELGEAADTVTFL